MVYLYQKFTMKKNLFIPSCHYFIRIQDIKEIKFIKNKYYRFNTIFSS